MSHTLDVELWHQCCFVLNSQDDFATQWVFEVTFPNTYLGPLTRITR